MLARPTGYVVDVTSLTEAIEFAKIMAATEMVPKGDQGKAGNVLAKMQIGAEIGLAPMQAINTLYVTNGKVGMEVKSMLALIIPTGLLESKKVTWSGPGPQEGACTATVKRVGCEPYSITFGPEEARKAGLLGGSKDTYTKWDWRMFYNRAMGFALQDEFQDVLRGTVSLEYLRDSGAQVAITDVPDAQVDGRPVRAALMPADPDLEPLVVKKMTELGLKPGQRLAKLQEYRGRLPVLSTSLDEQLTAKSAMAAQKATEGPVIQVQAKAVTVPSKPQEVAADDHELEAQAERVIAGLSDDELDAELAAMDGRR